MIKKISPILFFIFYCFCSFLFDSFSFALIPTNPYVKVQGSRLAADFTGNGNYQTYVVKGVDYGPTPIGRYSSDFGYAVNQYDISQTSPNPSGLNNNIFADTNILDRDFPLLSQMNANTVRIYGDNTQEVSPAAVSDPTFENAFPTQLPSYGDNILSWLQSNGYVNPSGFVTAELTSSAVLSALQAEFTDPGEYDTILDILELAQNGDQNPGRFPNFITSTTLSTAGTHGLKVIAGFFVAPFGSFTSSCPAPNLSPDGYCLNTYNAESNDPGLNAPFDLTNPYIRNDILMRFEIYVNTFKNDPNILFWAIGNENNLSLDSSNTTQIQAWYSLVNQMAGAAHQIEGANDHPVAVVNGDIGFIGQASAGADDKSMTNLDIWGANTYRGQSFNDYFLQYKALSAKPFWISEYGLDAWQSCDTTNPSTCDPNNPSGGAEDQIDQATWEGGLWNEIAGNGDSTIGATIFEYSDEWWKPYDFICNNYPYTQYPPPPPDNYSFGVPAWEGNYCHWNHEEFGYGSGSSWGGLSTSPPPDNYVNEEWWGLMEVSNTAPETQPDTMTPRLAYYTLQGEFGSNAALPSYLASPVNNGTVLSTTTTFTWSLGRGVTQYQLSVGTTPGGDDIYSTPGGETTDTSAIVSGIPSGEPVYVQLVSSTNSAFAPNLPNYNYGSGNATATIKYTYQSDYNAITASAGLGGTISPLGIVNVKNGANQTFFILPSTGYAVSQVLVDGIASAWNTTTYPLGTGGALTYNTYPFTAVTTTHTIAASFTQVVYTLSTSTGGSGTITCGGVSCPTSVDAGASETFTATPASGSSFGSWGGACAGVGTTSSPYTCTIPSINANTSVSVSFTQITYTLSTSTGGSGSGTITCGGVSCPTSVDAGASETFTATPASGSSFGSWGGACAGVGTTSSPYTCTIPSINANTSVSVSFTQITYTLSTSTGGSGSGTITCGGVSCPSSVDAGVAETFTATPASGSSFGSWGGACAGVGTTSSPYTCTIPSINANTSVSVSFTQITYTLSTSTGGSGSGTITCGGVSCPTSVDAGASETFTATPASGSSFGSWGGACAGVGTTSSPYTCTIPSINANTSVSVSFTQITYTLSTSTGGSGSGTITCGGVSCPTSVDAGASETFTATPASGSSFGSWGGACAGVGTTSSPYTCTIPSINANTSVSVSFTQITYTLSTSTGGSGSGTITCGGVSCPTSVDAGASETFTATPASGSSFGSWGGACAGVGTTSSPYTCTIPSINANTSVSVSFTQITYTLSISTSGSGSGTITCGGVSCPTSVDAGASETFTATPASGSSFGSWGGACAGVGTTSSPYTCTIPSINANTSVSVSFTQITYTLSTSTGGSGSGTITCGGVSCPTSVDAGASETFTATPASGSSFGAWGGACAGVGTTSSPYTCTIPSINANTSVSVSFTQVSHVSPMVSITFPTNGTSFTVADNGVINIIIIRAVAVESGGSISKVAFYNGSSLLGNVTSSPYIFIWHNVIPGKYSLTAVATDTTGAMTVSSAVAIAVTGLPQVSLSAVNTSSAAPATIDLTAFASEANGNISKVEFYNDSTLLGTVRSSPYKFTWSNVPAGKYFLTAVAYDNNNRMTRSDWSIVTVNGLPVVYFSATVDNANGSTEASINLAAAATEADGTITKVNFYNVTTEGSILLSTETAKPYQFKWNNVPPGSYLLEAVATDSNNNSTTSKTVAVTIP